MNTVTALVGIIVCLLLSSEISVILPSESTHPLRFEVIELDIESILPTYSETLNLIQHH